MNASSSIGPRSGSMNQRCACSRPRPETAESRMMARARNAIERSRRRSQVIAVTTPRTTNAMAVASCR